MGEGLVNVHALAQQFEWALENMAPPRGLWHGFKCEEFGYDEKLRVKTREAFLRWATRSSRNGTCQLTATLVEAIDNQRQSGKIRHAIGDLVRSKALATDSDERHKRPDPNLPPQML
jgi:hypothetical protein